jgi:hypothetical protein
MSGALAQDWRASELPETVGAWRRFDELSTDTVAGRGFQRVYRAELGSRTEVYVGPILYGVDGAVDSYWADLASLGGYPLTLTLAGGETVTVNKAIRGAGTSRRLILYWYDSGRTVYADGSFGRLAALWHRVTGSGRQPVLVVVSCFIGALPEHAVAEQALSEFARDLIDAFRLREA